MKLIIVNGSPRGEKGNTETLLKSFINGFESNKKASVKKYHLCKDNFLTIRDSINDADVFILALPLYVSSMPGMIKEFIETLSSICGKSSNPSLGVIIQSGFPEAIQSRYLEKYFEKLSLRLRCDYLGTVIKGHCGTTLAGEGREHLLSSFSRLGKNLGEKGRFDAEIIKELAQPERFSIATQLKLKILFRLGCLDGYYNCKLKENKAFSKRRDMPYADPARSVEWYVIVRHKANEFLRDLCEYGVHIKAFLKRE